MDICICIKPFMSKVLDHNTMKLIDGRLVEKGERFEYSLRINGQHYKLEGMVGGDRAWFDEHFMDIRDYRDSQIAKL